MFIDHLFRLIPDWGVSAIYKIGDIVFGKQLALHQIPFGPIRGRKIYMRFRISPRMFFGVNEPWVSKMILQHTKPGYVVYDLGAHIGYTCLLFTAALSEKGEIHAFEILPSNVKILGATLAENPDARVTIHPVGVADDEQEIELPASPTGMTSIYSPVTKGSFGEKCATVALDLYVSKKGIPYPDIMKIDIEGAEIAFMDGAQSILKEVSPQLIIEFHGIDRLRKGHEILSQFGYKMQLEDGRTIDQSVIEKIQTKNQNVYCWKENN
jgi:FkbM family methyltransferase